ncbi:MAG TPA: LysM peptidoglycan-binding domain-containing protein, partial [Polyangiaceae bacterium]
EVAPPSTSSPLPTPPAVAPVPTPAAPIPTAPPIQQPSTPTAVFPSLPSLPSLPDIPVPSIVPPAAVSPAAPTPVAPSTPTPAPAATPILSGLDPNMPPEMQKAVAGALTTESDPAKLEGFASAIQAQYPIASGLLKAKAEGLRLMAGVTVPTMPTPSVPAPAPRPSTPIAPPLAPIATSGTYTVIAGDYPIKIAQKFTGNGNRWHELIAANPQKKTAADGNFATLLPGEVLKLPASWTSAPPSVVAPASTTPPAPLTPQSVAANLGTALAAVPAALGLPALPSLPPAPPATPLALPMTSTSSAGGTYKVLSGDNPSKIAQKVTGNANRWKELVAANPQKKTGADGNFTSLMPGETLHLPASWTGGGNAAHA